MTRGGLGRIAKRRWVGRARITPAGPPCSLYGSRGGGGRWARTGEEIPEKMTVRGNGVFFLFFLFFLIFSVRSSRGILLSVIEIFLIFFSIYLDSTGHQRGEALVEDGPQTNNNVGVTAGLRTSGSEQRPYSDAFYLR